MSSHTQGDPAPRARLLAQGVAAVVSAGLVFGIGWLTGQGGSASKPAAPAHEGEKEAEAGHAAHGAKGPVLSPRTLQNLGVVVEEAALSEHVDTRDVPAVVALPAAATRPVHAPVAGIVRRVLVREGQRVPAGAPVAEVLRDPFPRPSLPLTDQLLRPLNEDFHASLAALRSAGQSLRIVRDELARIRKVMESVGGGATLPVKTEIDLVYEERRSVASLENARAEALRHGLTADEVASVESGGTLPEDFPMARRILDRNGLWSAEAEAVLGALPAEVRSKPYSAVVLGELVGTNGLTPDLVRAVKERPALAAAFLDLAGLVQEGAGVDRLLALESAGALATGVVLHAPPATPQTPDWDVAALEVRDGARVEAGTAVLVLHDARQVQLRLAPAGADLPAVASALAASEPVSAEPLVAGSGPVLDGLHLVRIAASGDAEDTHGAAWATARNEPLHEVRDAEGRDFRSWRLRPGLQYVVRVPQRRLAGRFVLPADAVVGRGPESVVLIEDGARFKAVPVRVEHRDARVAVVANDGAVFPGDRVVVRGAYALSLALQAASGGAAADPHAGHNH